MKYPALLVAVIVTGASASLVTALQIPFDTYQEHQLAAAVTATGSTYASGQLIVGFKPGVGKKDRDTDITSVGGSDKSDLPQINARVIHVPPGQEKKTRDTLSHNPHVQYAELDYEVQAALVPNDSKMRTAWWMNIVSEPAAWDISTGSNAVTIAIVDTGASTTPTDIAENMIPGYNVLSAKDAPNDDNGHGTAVADIADGVGNNTVGVAGPTWHAKLLPIKVLSSTGSGYMSDVATGILYAADHGAKVINLSLGATTDDATVQNAVNYAWGKGAVIVAASGNSAGSSVIYPAGDKNVVAVGATGAASTSPSGDSFASYSNYGSGQDLTAPGSSIIALGIQFTGSPNTFAGWTGTSMASPMAAGLVALMWSVNPNLTNTQIVDLIEKNSDDLGAPGWDQYYGYGRINAYKAVLAAKNATAATDVTAPSASISAPSAGSTLSGATTVSVTATDSVGVTKVELYKDGALYATSSTAPYAFYWDTTTDTNASHTLSAKAYDAAGNVGSTANVSITVANTTGGAGSGGGGTSTSTPTSTPDTTAPSVTISSPANGTKLKGNGSVSIVVSATDASGIGSITLLGDGATLTTCSGTTSCSYTWSGKSIATGSHTITATAIDASSNKNSNHASVIVTK